MKMRLLPEDDLMHPLEEAVNFNESAYYNFHDAGCGLGGWVRMGNRANEGYAELTICLYLPDGSVAFAYKKPKITDNLEHNAGGLRFEVLEPFVHHKLTYDGKVNVLKEPKDMEDPKKAFTDLKEDGELRNPRVPCTIALDLRGLSPMHGGEPVNDDGSSLEEDPEKAFARGHTEQLMSITGTVTVGDTTFELSDARGLRDHSWGPRYWQAVWWYRWLTVNLGQDMGFATTVAGTEAGHVGSHGFFFDRKLHGDVLVPIRKVELKTDYSEGFYHEKVHAKVHTDAKVYDVEGTVWSNIPLRNRREGLVTRINEGMTTWRCEGLEGAGLSEYLDQVVDGTPVGTIDGY